MILATHTVPINTLPEVVWNMWTDVESWPEWDASLISAKINGAFTQGTIGELVMQNGQRTSFRITECTPYQSFTVSGNLWGASLHFEHDLKNIDGTLYVRHTAYLTGILKSFFWLLMKNNFKTNVPESLNALARLAENFGFNTQTIGIND